MTNPVLSIDNLQTHFFTRAGVVKAVDNISLSVNAGEILGLVGESGSGKSITGFSILGLVDEPGRIVGGSIKLSGEELIGKPEAALRRIRGGRASMIFQDPMMTLNPVLRIETQMIEAIRAHEKVPRREAWQRARDGLAQVGIPSPEERLKCYPHELSGGMRQRVAIAIAFLNRPEFIVADEPTTALDVTIQSQILAEAQKLCRENRTAMIWITHDLSVVAGLADTIAVMYAGRIVENGPAEAVLRSPRHPYTSGLIKSVPGEHLVGQRLFQIPGMTPSLLKLGEACAFKERCAYQDDACSAAPPISMEGGRACRCFHPLRADTAAQSGGAAKESAP
ncbi:ABC transporter ATP-binding protein [Nitratireductor sp. ZSWI3]|uniref:ABC transporter ATP-binding protein n=1 Tax=Nitratireductor sp. ZSWI3 TaxID=2966359 RepID=UPI0021503A27|nr:ABC transporter ATP-binding protein [Nitratireductor sp. ZSWI3]MCR4265224.1 ABC transporter ATP-binding protein [Nitratireductor sp. ZSWI3]